MLPALQPLLAVAEQISGVYKAGLGQHGLRRQVPGSSNGDHPGEVMLMGNRTQPPHQFGGVSLATPVGVSPVAKLNGPLYRRTFESASGNR